MSKKRHSDMPRACRWVVFGMSEGNFQDSSTMNIEMACSARIIRNKTEFTSAEDYVIDFHTNFSDSVFDSNSVAEGEVF